MKIQFLMQTQDPMNQKEKKIKTTEASSKHYFEGDICWLFDSNVSIFTNIFVSFVKVFFSISKVYNDNFNLFYNKIMNKTEKSI